MREPMMHPQNVIKTILSASIILNYSPVRSQELPSNLIPTTTLNRVMELKKQGKQLEGVRTSSNQTIKNVYDTFRTCDTCFGTGVIYYPSDLSGFKFQSKATNKNNFTYQEANNPTTQIIEKLKYLISIESTRIDDVCTRPFLGDTNETESIFGDGTSLNVVTPSEIFSAERPGLWLSFTITVIDNESVISWTGGLYGKHKFIIDNLRYSPRGFCVTPLSSPPLPNNVTDSFEDEVRISIEKKISSNLEIYFNIKG